MSTAPAQAQPQQQFHPNDGVKSNHGPAGKVLDAQFDPARGWLYAVDFKGVGVRKNQPENTLSRSSTKTKAPYTPATGKDLADYLQKQGYKLWVMVRKPNELAKVRMEYEEATGRNLPTDCIKENYGGKGNFSREWYIQAPYSDGMPSDYEIVEGGSGTGYGKNEPVGIRQGNVVTFAYWEIVKEMLQSGLKAQR